MRGRKRGKRERDEREEKEMREERDERREREMRDERQRGERKRGKQIEKEHSVGRNHKKKNEGITQQKTKSAIFEPYVKFTPTNQLFLHIYTIFS
jgi:hypothetical protein